jgi:hypothetical protein
MQFVIFRQRGRFSACCLRFCRSSKVLRFPIPLFLQNTGFIFCSRLRSSVIIVYIVVLGLPLKGLACVLSKKDFIAFQHGVSSGSLRTCPKNLHRLSRISRQIGVALHCSYSLQFLILFGYLTLMTFLNCCQGVELFSICFC